MIIVSYLLGVYEIDQILQILLTTNMLVGGTVGFVFDNILPGTDSERGIKKWQNPESPESRNENTASQNVFDVPVLTRFLGRSKICKYIPFLPYYGERTLDQTA